MTAYLSREPLLFGTAAFHLLLFLLFLCLIPFDSRTILGISPWIKPAKFAVSISIYLATLGVLMPLLPTASAGLELIRWTACTTMLLEMVIISVQSARGVASHFNIATGLDATLFYSMGVLIVLNTLAAFGLLILFLTSQASALPGVLLGIRIGLALFIAGSLQGFMMVSRMAHTVGASDGGAGLPFLNWSTQAGDLRVTHFLFLHAIQVLPLAGWLFRSPAVVWVIALAWSIGGAVLLQLALRGRPLTSGF